MLVKGVVDAELFAGIYDYAKSPFTPEEMYRFNGLMGVDKGVQDVFARLFVEYAHAKPEDAYEVTGNAWPSHFYSAGGENERPSEPFREFMRTIEHIRNMALPEAARLAEKLRVDGVQLFGIGWHDNAMTANIALGNVDTATNVTVNFLGMNSKASAIGDALASSHDNLKQAMEVSEKYELGNSFAVVVSISHKSAGLHNYGESGSARASVDPVTDLLDGINYSRDVEQGGSPADQGFRLDTRWHSYGTRDASAIADAESKGIDALETNVSSFSLYGSPGIISGLEASDFPADRVYVTKASSDSVAHFGRLGSDSYNRDAIVRNMRHENPESIPGVDLYNSDGGDGYKAVTSHARYVDQEERPGEYGYDNYNTSSNYASALIMNGLEPELLSEAGE